MEASSKSLKPLPPGEPLSIVFLGKTGHGKSATANNIFGEDRFPSSMSTQSVSSKSQMEICSSGGREICLVDTPGTMDTKNPIAALKELGAAISFRTDGFHAFMFVVRADMRFTEEEQMAIKMLKDMFGEDIIKNYGVFIFTHGDIFLKSLKKQKLTITFDEYIRAQTGELGTILKECNYRCALIDNYEDDPDVRRDQIIAIIKLVDGLCAVNGSKKYTNQMFRDAKKQLDEEQARIDKEKAALAKKHDDEIKEAAEEETKKKLDKKYEEDTAKLLEQERNKVHVVGDQLAYAARAAGVGGCFPSDTFLTLNDGSRISITDLRIGQKVLPSASFGTLTYSEVYFFAHLNPNVVSKYIKLRSSKQFLKLSPQHYIHVVRNCHVLTIPAEEVKIGDSLLAVNRDHSSLKDELVMEISESYEAGAYAPITMTGNIVVNNVLVSCYVDIVPPVYAHPLLWPLRQLYRLSPSLTARINAEGKEGIPTWVKWIMDNVLA